jgi:diaminohydroxyphosphoribosylaminopyrimidine deaminase / 5-amino-6-(5-phosphoribosylamino)uracil reductase
VGASWGFDGDEKIVVNSDEQWMRRALTLARLGRTSPNPMVGAVVVKGGKVVAEGYHLAAGSPHAERVALARAGKRARGATLYVTLEPCVHYGRTPPCAPAVVESGVSRVVVAMEDPNPLVKGRGIARLRDAGIDVRPGVLERAARVLNEAFCTFIVSRKPFVLLKAAATLDGRTADRTGESKWISGEASRRLVHRMRDRMDAVLVGIGTVLRDDPQLTARIPGGKDPLRVVLDSRLRIPEKARLFGEDPSRVIILTTDRVSKAKADRLRRKGAEVWTLPATEAGRVDFQAALTSLGSREITSLLVEGGSRVHGAFLDAGLADKLALFFTPRILGDSEAAGLFAGKGSRALHDAFPLRDMTVRRLGADLLIEGYLKGNEE